MQTEVNLGAGSLLIPCGFLGSNTEVRLGRKHFYHVSYPICPGLYLKRESIHRHLALFNKETFAHTMAKHYRSPNQA